MPLFNTVLCALDSSPLGPRVLRHAVGVAAVCDAQLTLLKVVSSDARRAEADVAAMLRDLVPSGAFLAREPRIRALQLSMGQPADAVVDAAQHGTDLIVAGTHSKSGWSRWFLGSTSAAILEQAPCPVMLIPPGEAEVVTLGSTEARLSPGAVLAAVDLNDVHRPQLTMAGDLAALAGQPLVLMTVADAAMSDEEAERALRACAAQAGLEGAARFVVRRGNVADEIDRAAVAERAGLVVMGLRAPEKGTPGGIATAVLKTKDAVVLAVPDGPRI